MQEVFEKIIEKLEVAGKTELIAHGGRRNGKTLALGYAKGISEAIKITKQEAEKHNNGWIPCSERMPEDEQVALTCKCKSISILRYSTKTNHWYELSGNWWWSANMVTAWQPLPAPYQPKGE